MASHRSCDNHVSSYTPFCSCTGWVCDVSHCGIVMQDCHTVSQFAVFVSQFDNNNNRAMNSIQYSSSIQGRQEAGNSVRSTLEKRGIAGRDTSRKRQYYKKPDNKPEQPTKMQHKRQDRHSRNESRINDVDNKNAVVNRNNGDSLRDSGQTANQAESIRRHKYETKYESCKEETKKHETNKHKTNKYDTICELSCNSNSIDYGMQLIDEPAAVIFPANQCAKAGKHFSQHLRRQLGLKRTDEGHGLQTLGKQIVDRDVGSGKNNDGRYTRSPYLKRQLGGRTTVLERSNNKIRSGLLVKQTPNNFYKQPRSSLSQHYEPGEDSNVHKRRVSLVGNDKSELLDEAKQLYRLGNYSRCIQLLKRCVQSSKASVQAHYLLGMSFINSGEFTSGTKSLKTVLDMDPHYKRSLYLVVALACKKLGMQEEAITILNKGIQLYYDYYDCLVYRGKLHLKAGRNELALQDFTSAIAINPRKGFAYVGKGTCEKNLGLEQQALATFQAGLATELSALCFEKRGIMHYEAGRLDSALEDLQQSSFGEGGQSSTVHYLKGMIYWKQSRTVEALLSFQECINSDNNRENVTGSVEMILRLKVEEKDFYEAYHVLNRSSQVDVDRQVLHEWRLFLQASLFLMKKKYKEGIDLFTSLLLCPLFRLAYSEVKGIRPRDRYSFLKPLVLLYKAFGELSENRPQQAEQVYSAHTRLCKELNVSDNELSKEYNLLLIKAYCSFPNTSMFIEQAIQLIPSKPEPYLLLAFDRVHNRLLKASAFDQQESAAEAIDYLQQGISQLPQLSSNHISSFYFYRAVLWLFRNQCSNAAQDVDKAIEKSEDNIPKYFYLRGLIFACFGNFGQAIQDLSVAINLDDSYSRPYLERAKCLQIEGSSNSAFLDLQKYITLAPKDKNIHKYAGYLLFQNCAYEDCLSALSHGAELDEPQLILTKAKCHFLLGDYPSTMALLNRYSQETGSHEFDTDSEIIGICQDMGAASSQEAQRRQLWQLQQILQREKEEDCRIFKFRDIHQMRGSIFLLLGDFHSAIDSFEKTLALFNAEKQRELEKHYAEDSEEFQDEWSEIEIKFNVSLCYLGLRDYQRALQQLQEFSKCCQKGKNWSAYIHLIQQLAQGEAALQNKVLLDTFQQKHRISRLWPRFRLTGSAIDLSLAFSYPFVEPPELLPEFDPKLWEQFHLDKVQIKPQAPWINRGEKGLIFTPNIQAYDNLELSMTSTKRNEGSEKGKPTSEQHSADLPKQVHLQKQQLRKKFKLDSLVEMKLNRLICK